MNNALKGNNQEVIYTKELNKKNKFWKKLPYEKTKTYAIHVTSKVYGKINSNKVHPKSDVFFATGFVPIDFLVKNDFYLKETHVKDFDLKPIKNSGLSIKMSGSKYTIMKISPNTFKKVFGSNVLACGASIYCNKEDEFIKNDDVLLGWGIDFNEFSSYFSSLIGDSDEISLTKKDHLVKIKSYSNNQISNLIESSTEISDFVFKGKGNFEEPYTAHWIIENEELKENYYMPFSITTGSGRSKGNYTIVLKPK